MKPEFYEVCPEILTYEGEMLQSEFEDIAAEVLEGLKKYDLSYAEAQIVLKRVDAMLKHSVLKI